MSPDFDHLSFAVHDAMSWAQRLRRELGAVPIGGEVLPEFRFVLMHVGTATSGSRIELMEPNGPGFLARFLEKHGEAAHHITFTVPDLQRTVAQVRDIGATVVKESYGHLPWQEAFVFPDERHGVVIQLAQSNRSYPSPASLVSSRERDVKTFPSARGATDLTWWSPVWEATAESPASVVRNWLATTDLTFSLRLLEEVLGGRRTPLGDVTEMTWPGGRLALDMAARAGVQRIDVTGTADGLLIGNVLVVATAE